jgi:hypothetical protein
MRGATKASTERVNGNDGVRKEHHCDREEGTTEARRMGAKECAKGIERRRERVNRGSTRRSTKLDRCIDGVREWHQKTGANAFMESQRGIK